MTQYAIADIGSNTIVLLVYEIENNIPKPIFHISTPTHLIDYVDDRRQMSQEGIQAAKTVLQTYSEKLNQMHIKYRWADITEPCRITNRDVLIKALQTTGWEIYPLTGDQEAEYDFQGALYSYPWLNFGIAFDVGGGSTELISFQDGKPIDAKSFPLGCVRLHHLPLNTSECEKNIMKIRNQFPSLNISCKELIGIGGTVRAAGKIYQAIYQKQETMAVDKLLYIYRQLLNHNAVFETIMKENVDSARQPVFLSGLHMVLEIARIYQANMIYISKTGIREGFLKARLQQLSNNNS